MGRLLVNPALSTHAKVNPALSTYQKLYAGGSNCVLKDWAIGGAAPTTFSDKSGCGNNGTFTNVTMAQLASGIWTYQFNGTTSYIAVSDTLGLNITARPLTIAAWVNPASDAVIGYVIARNATNSSGDVQFGLAWAAAGSYMNLEGSTRATAANNSAPVSAWSLIGGTWSAAGVPQMYVNGVASGSAGASFTSALTSKVSIAIGRRFSTTYFKGDGALWRVLPVAWSAADWLKAYQMERVLFGV